MNDALYTITDCDGNLIGQAPSKGLETLCLNILRMTGGVVNVHSGEDHAYRFALTDDGTWVRNLLNDYADDLVDTGDEIERIRELRADRDVNAYGI